MRCFHFRRLREALWRFEHDEHSARTLKLQISLPNGITLGASAMNLTLQSGASENFSVAFADANGNPAAAPGPVTVSTSDDTIAVPTLSADGSTLTVAGAASKLGTATVTVTSGVLSASIDVTVEAGVATQIILTDLGPTPVVAAPAEAPAVEAAPAAEVAPADAAPAADASADAAPAAQ